MVHVFISVNQNLGQIKNCVLKLIVVQNFSSGPSIAILVIMQN